MRIRSVKPEFWGHQLLAGLDRCSPRLLAIALLNYADDEGYFLAHVGQIWGQLFPFEEDSSLVAAALKDLEKIGFVEFGTLADGRAVGRVVNFTKHQVVNHPKRSALKPNAVFPSAPPPPQTPGGSTTGSHTGSTTGSTTGTLLPGMEGNGKEGRINEPSVPLVSPDSASTPPEPQTSPDSILSDPEKKKKVARSGKELAAAMAEVCDYEAAALTKPAWKRIGTALRDIRQVEPDLTPDRLRAVAARYRKEWPNVTLSPTALSSNWAQFAVAARAGASPTATIRLFSDTGHAEPAYDWRAKLADEYPAMARSAATIPWRSLPADTQLYLLSAA